MGFSEAVRACFGKYVTFSGRATRPEYWYFILFIFLVGLILSVFDAILFGGTIETTPNSFEAKSSGPLVMIFSLATFLPNFAAGWRRMHDTGRSGLFLLYPLIVAVGVGLFLGVWGGLAQVEAGGSSAFVGGIGAIIAIIGIFVMVISPLIVLWWLTRPSQPDDNEFGPATKTSS